MARMQSLKLALICLLATTAAPSRAGAPRDGSHDFDFARGAWRTHATQVLNPFDGGTQTVVMDGTKTATPLWSGKAWIEEIEADGPNGHWQGMTLFVYNPASGQWSQQYIDSNGEIDAPTIGRFEGGRGELYGTRDHKGENVLVRNIWSGMTANAHHFEISLSRDGGRTWALAFKADLTRISK